MLTVKNIKAFSLIELLIVVGMTFILSSMAIPVYGNMQSSTDLGESTMQSMQLFRKARTWSYNAYRDKSYGVYFNDINKSFVLYAGDTYALRDQSLDIIVKFSPGIIIDSAIVGKEIHFAKYTGMPDKNGFFDLRHQAINGMRRININYLGVVDTD